MNRGLIAFHRVRGKHSGERLARIALNITDRAKITAKVRSPYFLKRLLIKIILEDGPLDARQCFDE
jgi:hypothetical protein